MIHGKVLLVSFCYENPCSVIQKFSLFLLLCYFSIHDQKKILESDNFFSYSDKIITILPVGNFIPDYKLPRVNGNKNTR